MTFMEHGVDGREMAGPDLERLSRLGWASPGMDGRGLAVEAWYGRARTGEARRGGHGMARLGPTSIERDWRGCRGRARRGAAGLARMGMARLSRFGWDGQGMLRVRRGCSVVAPTGEASDGEARTGVVRRGKAVEAWTGLEQHGEAWLGGPRLSAHGMAWRGCLGKGWRGRACKERARPGCQGKGGQGLAWDGVAVSTRLGPARSGEERLGAAVKARQGTDRHGRGWDGCLGGSGEGR